MNSLKIALISLVVVVSNSSLAAVCHQQNSFIGSWALDIPGGYAGWLGVSERDGKLSASLMWGSGSVVPVPIGSVTGDQLILLRTHTFEETGADGKKIRKGATES